MSEREEYQRKRRAPRPELPFPYSRPFSESYAAGLKELHQPFPAMQLSDWGKFNKITGGLRPREFSILCGPTGRGKTTFLANLSAQLLKADVRQYIASVETGDTDFAKRVMSVFAQEDLNTGDAIPLAKLEALHNQFGAMMSNDNSHLALFEDRISMERLCDELEYHCRVKKCKVALLDNLNFFMDTANESDWIREMDRVVHSLIILTKQIDMHIVMVMHPKKTDGGRVESEFDIKGSSTAVQEAHNVWLFNQPSDYICKADSAVHQRTHREIKFAKLRRRGSFNGARLVFKNVAGHYREGEVYFDN